jgi:hypothetical protein
MRKFRSIASGGRFALLADFADVARTFKGLFDPYRPELHYMRGPGPKWHAKHAQPTVAAPDTGMLQKA